MRFRRRRDEGVHERYTSNRWNYRTSIDRIRKKQKMKIIEKDRNENHDLLSLLRNVIFIIAVYIYFVGWIYAFYLFEHFGIALNSVDIPFYYFFVYAYSVIITNPIAVIIIICVTMVIFYSVTYLCTSIYSKGSLLVPVLIILFPIFFFLAKESANKSHMDIRMGNAKTIKFVFKKDAHKIFPKEFIDANTNGSLKILTETDNRFYVFYQPDIEEEEKEVPYGYTFGISKTDILLAKIDIPNTLKIGGINE
jgi:hypothetical protein